MGKDSKKRKKHHHDDSDSDKDKKKSKKKIEKVAQLLGYSNEVNPFNDSNLLQPFVWKKKKEKDVKENNSSSSISEEQKRLQLLEEIDRVRKRREEREQHLIEMERLRNEEQRLKDMAQYSNWQEKEEEFHIEQIRSRSIIRIIEKREDIIDLIVKNIILFNLIDNKSNMITNKLNYNDIKEKLLLSDIEYKNPIFYIESLNNSQDLIDLSNDINNYIELEKISNGINMKYFESILIVISNQINQLSNNYNKGIIHESIVEDVKKIMNDKTTIELDNLQNEINNNLLTGKVIDREYWENINNELNIQRSKAYITEVYYDLIRTYEDRYIQLHNETLSKQQEKMKNMELSLQQDRYDDVFDDSEIASALYLQEKEKGFEENEEILSNEIKLSNLSYDWIEKYKPRKPRYFNRVRSGYDWNRYNSAHYDKDNPPPKMIQGYRFTIFYPDLIDKYNTPKFYIEKCLDDDSNDYVMIRFHSGPPYEDIAFKIINKQWDKDPKYGFKSSFDRGILTLNFNFRRYLYKR